jgi:hypothetical protein
MQHSTTPSPGVKFYASQPSIAGTALYFTGSNRFDLVNSPFISSAKLFDSEQAAAVAVKPWNDLGHSFVVSQAPVLVS